MAALIAWPAAWFADATIAAFLCILGGNVASFLNVVAHRAPRGESVVRGGSRCPACGSPVRWHDNVPVLGWLVLGGRCRDCGSPIDWRYPLVEAAGMLIGAITAVELLSGGRTWPPGRFGTGRIGADVLLMQPDWPLALVCLAHAALLCVVLAWTLFEADGVDVPWSWWCGTCLGLCALAVAAGGPLTEPGWPAATQAVLGGGVAGVVGAAVGNRVLGQALVCAGCVLGWQGFVTAVAVMPLAAAVRIGLGAVAGRRHAEPGPRCVDLLVAIAVQAVVWWWLAAVWQPCG